MRLTQTTYCPIKPLVILLMGLLAISICMRGMAQDISLSIIANTEGVPDSLTSKEMKKIFLGQKQRWKNNKVIKIAMLKPDTKVGSIVSDKIYGLTPNELKKYWLALAFQGRAKTPKFFDSAEELKNYVSITPGSVGIIEYTSRENLKFVLVDNKKFF